MSCTDGSFIRHRENRLELTVYTDTTETTPEDLTGKTFSAVIYLEDTPATVYGTAVGTEQVLVPAPETGRITLVFPPDAFEVNWSAAVYVVDDITDVDNVLPFLPPAEITMVDAAEPALPVTP